MKPPSLFSSRLGLDLDVSCQVPDTSSHVHLAPVPVNDSGFIAVMIIREAGLEFDYFALNACDCDPFELCLAAE